MILGLGCNHKRPIVSNQLVLLPRPTSRPAVVDKSPKPCPECTSVNGQKMWKFTERDFLLDKEKHLEKDDYIDYLLEIISPK